MVRATSGKTIMVLVALLLAAGWSTGCSTPPAAPATVGPQTVCLGRAPASWTAALERTAITLPDGVTFGIGAVDAGIALGQYDTGHARGVGYVDLVSGQLVVISTYASGVSGLGGLAVERPWVVWEQLESVSDLSDWSVRAYNLNTRTSLVLASSGHLAGQQPMPVLRNGVAAWAQPVRGGSRIRAVDLASRRDRVVAEGMVGAPAYAGRYLLWPTADGSFQGVEAVSLRPVELPGRLRRPGDVRYLAGSAEYLVWSSGDSASLTVWPFRAGDMRTYVLPDRRHYFQFLQIAGDFVVWFSGLTSSVLDLTTGAGFDLPGTVAGSPDWIAASPPPTPPGPNARGGYAVRRIATRLADHITRCA